MNPDSISNIFDFIDYLEGQNFTPGTANENRIFMFNTLEAGLSASLPLPELEGAYAELGISIPDATYTLTAQILEETQGAGNVIQILAPTSQIPGIDLPVITNGDWKNDYVSYFHVTFYDPDIEETITKKYYLTFDNQFTPSSLRAAASADFATKYGVQVTNIQLDRIYRTFGS